MSEGKSSSERHGDTREFELIRPAEPIIERTEFELHGHQRIPVRVDFREPIELRLGRDEQTPLCYLIRYPSHRGYEQWGVVQPTPFARIPVAAGLSLHWWMSSSSVGKPRHSSHSAPTYHECTAWWQKLLRERT